MIRWFAKRAIAAFERRWQYDAAYQRRIVDEAGVGAILPLGRLSGIGAFRRGIPAGPYYAAKLTASLAADCGACAQLTLAMAEDAGVAPATLRAIVAGDRGALTPDERLGYDLARATIARAPASDLQARILARFGRRGLVSLAYALVAAEAFPTFKYAIGEGHACVRLRLGDALLAPRREAATPRTT